MKNYNVEPYYDDYDPNKNYHRILFKPGVAVQARELTQSQTILQNQISKFASAIYSQNTPVTGGKITTNLLCEYIKLNQFIEGSSIVLDQFLGKTITDDTGTVSAKVITYAEATGNAITPGDPPTLIVSYTSGGKFSDGMNVRINSGGLSVTAPLATTIGTAGGTTSVGVSSVASISEGVFYVVNGYNDVENADGTTSKYQIGNFVNVQPQTIILEKYDNTPSYRVGLLIVENTITSSDDISLLDPASGYSNYQAPGADRYQINLELTAIELTPGNDDNFIELMRIEDGKILKQTDSTVYSAIDDYFAKRDYESNGDYVVEDFKLIPEPNEDGDGSKYDLTISKGIAYVRGYRIENQSQLRLVGDRARDTKLVDPASIFINYGSYFIVDNANNLFNSTQMEYVDLHCVEADLVNETNQAGYNSTLIGKALVRSFDFVSGTGSNTANYTFNAHVCDVNLYSLTGVANTATTTTLQILDATSKFSTANDAYNGVKLVITGGTNSGDFRYVTDYNGSTKTFTVDSAWNITPDNTSTFALDFQTKDVESLTQVNTSNWDLTSWANISPDGKIEGTGDTVFESPGAPELIFKVGYDYTANVNDSSYYSTQIFRNVGFSPVSNTFTINTISPIQFHGSLNTPIYGDTFKQLFTVVNRSTGEILPFNTTANSVTLTSSTSAVFTSAAFANITYGIDVYASVFVSNGNNTNLILKNKDLIQGNTTHAGSAFTTVVANTLVDLESAQILIKNQGITTTPMSLYVNDVKKIKAILDVGTATPNNATSLANYTDITSSFLLDNGQRDNFYDHSTLKMQPGVTKPKGNILVIFDFYQHSGGDGYFSVNSYLSSALPETYPEIPRYVAKNGVIYNLRDCLDFRPCRSNLQTGYVWEYKTITNSNNVNIKGTLIPNALTNYLCNYSYYLGRKDKLVLTKDSKFLLIKGTPSLNPLLPAEPDGALVLANITYDPYTAYVPNEGPNYIPGQGRFGVVLRTSPSNISINKILHKRWAKEDITRLQNQVDNLEYYTSLNLLESNAQALQIPDENGLNRFKNGILVDDFSTFGTADSTAKNFSANINIRKKQMTALNYVDKFALQDLSTINSFGTIKKTNTYTAHSMAGGRTNVYTLPYTQKSLVKQQLASGAISCNPFDVALYEGVMTLNPPMDNWVNTNQPPQITIANPNMQFEQQYGGINLLNAGDWQSVVGTTASVNETKKAIEDSYVKQTQGLMAADASSSAAEGLAQNKGYITNNAVLPHIQPQEIIVRAKGMKINTPVSCWFDGYNVDSYMTLPNTIELINVTGKFFEDDVVGVYDDNADQFFPICRVAGVYKYPNGTSVRLYVGEIVNPPAYVTSDILINATFDISGNYISSSARGTIVFENGSFTSTHNSGTVTGVGGTFTSSVSAVAQNIFKTGNLNGKPTWFNQYSVWGNQSNANPYAPTYPLVIETAGVYAIRVYATGTGTVSINGTQIINIAARNTEYTYNYTATTGTKTLTWSVNNEESVAGFAMTITGPDGTMFWNTQTPNGLNFDAIGTEYKMPDGGSYFIGVTKFQLDQAASNIDAYYTGATITVTSTYLYEYKFGAIYVPPRPTIGGDGDAGWVALWRTQMATWQPIYDAAQSIKDKTLILSAVDTDYATVTEYDGETRTVTVNKALKISFGRSASVGNITAKYSVKGQAASYADVIREGDRPASLTTDEKGQFIAIFNIPGSVFHIGSRVFRIDNRSGAGAPQTATTYAESTFVAGAIQTTNSSNFSPSVDSSSKKFTPLSLQTYNVVESQSPNDPIAQTFIISKENYPNGVFLSSIKLFFSPFPGNVRPILPITVGIVNTLNGQPNGNTLDYSRVTLDADDVVTSNNPHYLDPTSYTEFKFSAPVYVQSGVLYAILISAGTSDYYVYYAQQNQVAISSTAKALPTDAAPSQPTKIGGSPYIGALFESQNSMTWTADQSKDLMFVIEQCVFDTTKTPRLQFVTPEGLPANKLGSSDVLSSIDKELISNAVNQNGAPTSPMHAFNLSTTDFVPTFTNINYTYSTTLSSDLSVTAPTSVTPGKMGTPLQDNIYFSDGLGERILKKSSSNSFQLFATLSSSDPNLSPLLADDGLSLFNIQQYVNNLGIESDSLINIVNGGANYNANATSITVSAPDFGVDRAVLDFTTNTSTGAIETVFVTYPGSGYAKTPTVSLVDASGNGSNAIVTVVGETSPDGGPAFAKYFTKKVILTPENDSGDLRVYYTAYKPLGSEVYVYYKIQNRSDTEQFEAQEWQLMAPVNLTTTYSKDRTNLIEFEVGPGLWGYGANNNISYTSTNGQVYTEFSQFAIKIVLATSDRTNVPFLSDIRALALPSGIGL